MLERLIDGPRRVHLDQRESERIVRMSSGLAQSVDADLLQRESRPGLRLTTIRAELAKGEGVLGIFLDTVALIVIAGSLSGQNMFDEWGRYLIFAVLLIPVSMVLAAYGLPFPVLLLAYFGAVAVGMRFLVGATWVGALIGAALFMGYKVVAVLIFASVFG